MKIHALSEKRWILLLAGACLTGVLLARCSPAADTAGIDPRGGAAMEVRLKLSPIHLQTDPRWRDETLGGSGEKFGSTGCAICGVSMALAEYGMGIPPDSLNRLMKASSGYTDRGWIKWDAIATVTGGRAWVDASAALSHGTIDEALRRGRPVLAKVMIGGSIAHWILIAGKQGIEYLMKDPLGDGRSLEPIGRYRSRIHAIRIVHADE